MAILRVGVVGCGLMGSGIAQVCAQKGFPTIIREVSEELLKKGMDRIRAFLQEGVRRGKIAQDEMNRTLGQISGTTAFGDLKDCDLVIEAVVENLDEKRKVFSELDRTCKPEAILASNTSSISLTALAAATRRPERVLGLHFMNPVPIMKLVEIVRPEGTSEATYALARAFAESLGKTVITAKDTPGFIVNLLLVPYLCEAVRALESGLATREDIDTGMELGCGVPMGPLKLLDLVGLDTTLYIADVLFEEFRTPKYAAPPLLRRMVRAGRLGRKSGVGFYEYASR
ncbi:MAG: 3-hydroxybutyryl-CoA dehydrogenase [Planctomycetes bacterium]|nr:3-hydroxybutyryl-CoA dehydrogenase [Planctomycetota bacterium]